MATGFINTNVKQGPRSRLKLCRGSHYRLWLWWLCWLMLCLIGLLLSYWQWQRAEQKMLLLEQQQQAETLHNPRAEPKAYSELILSGKFINEQSLWLDNRILNGRVGVALITPFIDVHGQRWLVDRGFLNTGGLRNSLTSEVPQRESRLYVISGTWQVLDVNQGGLLIRENRDGQRLLRIDPVHWPEADHFYSGVVHLKTSNDPQRTASGAVLLPWWQANPMPAERHFGYSLQWFLLALLALWIGVIGRRYFLTG